MRDRGPSVRGQSYVLGTALLLAITLAAAVTVVSIGGTAISDTREAAGLRQVEQGMTQFDSRAAEVALGVADTGSVDFGRVDGTITVRESVGRVTITHANHDGTDDDGNTVDDGNGDDEAVYNASIGALVYERRDTTIAYQGGGVWLVSDQGEARMISPPEFHYRSGTLTLPAIRTTGSGSASGEVSALITREGGPTRAFPNASSNYHGGSPPDKEYGNPVAKGDVFVTVESEFYQAWANYFRTRTDGTVTVDDANEEVRLKLGTLGATGTFPIPDDQSSGGGSQPVSGISGGHSLQSFSFTIVGKDDQNSRFKNLRWSMYVEEGNQHFELALGGSGNVDCGDTVKPTMYYSPDGGTTYQAWVATSGYSVTCSDSDGDGKDEAKVTIDLIGNPKSFEYTSISGSELVHFKNEVGSASFDAGNSDDLASDDTHGVQTVAAGDTESSDWLIKHYFAQLGPDFELRVEDQQGGGGAGVDENADASEGFIDYPAGSNIVRYLHVTENDVEIGIDG